VKCELEEALLGQGLSLRDFIRLSEYPLRISQYLLQEEYDKAWSRLKVLAELSSKASADSIWGRFMRQYEQWKGAVEHFSKAQTAWNDLNVFMAYAPDKIWSGVTDLRKEYETLEDQVGGGLKNDIDSQVNVHEGILLLKKLSDEVSASAPKFQGLASKISSFHHDIKVKLQKIINDQNLQALNHLLRTEGEKEWYAPGCQNTYQTTKDTYENFNNKVSDEGRARLEGKGRKTNWDLWVEIYTDLDSGKYVKKAEHEPYLGELEQIGLIERTVRLK
jgi:hypothetical protein